jgi:CheY-like chemotaxis protein
MSFPTRGGGYDISRGTGVSEGLAALRLLVIDDNPQMRSIIGTILAAAGVGQIHYASNGAYGLERVQSVRPDVV